MLRFSLPKVAALICCVCAAHAADHQWQHGTWRDIQIVAGTTGSITIPIGGLPPMTVAGVTIQGTQPTYITSTETTETEYVTIDGPDHLRYVARWNRRFAGVIINDPIDFTVEGRFLFVKGNKPGDAHKLELMTTTRLQP